MIHYLKIINFGPIREEAVMDFTIAGQPQNDAYEVTMPDGNRLLKLAYIYGANASGKTTVLKAFDFLRKLLLKPTVDKATGLTYEPFLFTEDPYDAPSRFELSFYCNDIRYVYELEFNKFAVIREKIVFYKTAKPTELFSRTTDLEKRLAKIEFGSKVKVPVRERDLLESNTLHNNTVTGAYAKTNVDIPELELLNKWFANFLVGLITSDNDLTEVTASLIEQDYRVQKWIDEFLNKADRQISGVKVFDQNIGVVMEGSSDTELIDHLLPESVRRVAFGKHNRPEYIFSLGGGSTSYPQRKIDFTHTVKGAQNYILPISTESSGTKRYFGLGSALYGLVHNSQMVCIDELETSLHPDLMLYFLQAFLVNSKNSQLLITTHNLTLMGNQDFIRKDALWLTEKNDDGSISLYAVSDFDSSVLRKDTSIINAYKTGKLGAKPNLGSPFIKE